MSHSSLLRLYHYIVARRNAKRATEEKQESKNHIRDVVAQEFDPAYYLTTYPDVKEAGIDPLEHFLVYGWREERNPNPEFSTSYYLTTYPDIREANINPFYHYIVAGRNEKRRSHHTGGYKALHYTEKATEEKQESKNHIRDVVAQEFDPAYYLTTYPDVKEAGIDPLEHFLVYGWREERNPNPEFSTSYYLTTYPDIREANINPFYHYIVAGRNEKRRSHHAGGYKVLHLIKLKSIEAMIQEWQMPERSVMVHKDASYLVNYINTTIPKDLWDNKNIVIALSHDNYTKSAGGIQLCIKIEEEEILKKRAIYVNIHPYKALPVLSKENDMNNYFYRIIINGDDIGVVTAKMLIEALDILENEKKSFHLIIHSLLGHSVNILMEMFQKVFLYSTFFWLHDFFSICCQYNLLRNEISYCNGPKPSSPGCNICIFGEERLIQLEYMQKLFSQLNPTILSPSEYALDIWKQTSNLSYQEAIVQPHLSVHKNKARIFHDKNFLERDFARNPLKVAFLGHPNMQKGWPIFNNLARKMSTNKVYQFYHFGTPNTKTKYIQYRSVSVIESSERAMIDALKNEKIDIAIIWSIGPETFCYTAHEALAAGAYIITCPQSGNVATMVIERKAGIVLENETELEKAFENRFFEDAVLLKASNDAWDVQSSQMTANYISMR